MFILGGNLMGLLPGAFTVTSHIIVTFALAFMVITIVDRHRLRPARQRITSAISPRPARRCG